MPYLVAAAAAALLAFVEQSARLGRVPWGGRAWRWWALRLSLEIAVALVFVFSADLLDLKVDKYKVADEWWGGLVLAASAAMVARSALIESSSAGSADPAATGREGTGLPGAIAGLPQGIIGFATYFTRARDWIEQRLDQTGAAKVSGRVVDEIAPAVLAADLDSAWLPQRVTVWIQGLATLKPADRLSQIRAVQSIADDDGVDELEKVRALLGLVVELNGYDMLKEIENDASARTDSTDER